MSESRVLNLVVFSLSSDQNLLRNSVRSEVSTSGDVLFVEAPFHLSTKVRRGVA